MTELRPPSHGFTRRRLLTTGAAGLGAVLAWQVAGGGAARAGTGGRSGPSAAAVPFDGGWLFGAWVDGGATPGFDDGGLEPATLPHTVVPLSWESWDPATWERVWLYRKHFDAPAKADGMRVFLDFDGAVTGSTVTVNGQAMPEHLGGYLPFGVELTGLLEPTGNVVAVELDATFNLDVPPDRPAPYVSTSVDFWQPGGIYRDVTLRVVPQVFLADVFAKPVQVLDAAARQVEVECTIDAATVPAGDVTVAVELRDGNRRITSTTVPATVSGTGQVSVTATLTGLAGITLWDLDTPKLYDVVATLSVGGAAVHDYGTRIGFREAVFQLDGFFLNGKRVKLFGLNRHQFFPFAGGALPARVQRKDAEILRTDLNCNMVRCSHYPQSEAFLDACDELGLMVWEEAPGWGYLGDDAWKQLVVRDVGDMVRRDRNHPSVIVWGARLNETDDDTDLYTATQQAAKQLDDSRPTVGAMAGRHDTTDYQQDVFSQNDYSTVTAPDGTLQPTLMSPRTDLPYMVSEAIGTLSGPAKYYRRTDTQQVQQSQATAHAQVHDIVAGDDAYCGLLAWSGYDYDSGSGNIFQGVKYTGVIDLFRVPKPGAALYQAHVDPAVRPVIQPAFYWDFGPTSPVNQLDRATIWSNLDRLEVYVGGTHFATATPDTTDFPHLPYPPSIVDFTGVDGSGNPELRIDGYLGSTRVASRSYSSDPAGDKLVASVDDQQLTGDGSDATRVVFRVLDKYRQPRPYVTGDVTLSVHGPAVLLGDNPFPFGDTGGVGAVWLRTLPHSPGTVKLTVTHDTLGSATVSVTVTPSG
jgi:beta-galactosidase